MSAKSFLFNRNAAWKMFIFLSVLLAIGLPITSIWETLLLFLSTSLIITIPELRTTSLFYKKTMKVFLLFLILLLLKHCFPILQINMGANLYMPTVKNESNEQREYQQLPDPVYHALKKKFAQYYPRSHWHTHYLGLSWQASLIKPSQTYSFSTESFWKHSNMSAYIHRIDFDSLETLRESFINNKTKTLGYYNWYAQSDPPSRQLTPFFIAFQFPQNSINSQLCWKGSVYWLDHFIYHSNLQCRSITSAEAKESSFIYGVSFPEHDNLSMHLILSTKYKIFYFLRGFLSLLMICFLFFSLQFDRKHFTKILLIFLIILPQIFILSLKGSIHQFSHFSETHVFSGGDDGLTYAGRGREIFYYLLHNQFLKALAGGAEVFSYMPLQRYCNAVFYFIFGESSLPSLFLLLSLFMLFYYYLDKICRALYSLPALLCLLIFIFLMHTYFSLAVENMSASIAFPCFVGALCLLTNGNKNQINHQHLFSVSFLFAIATMCRPNMLPAAIFILAYAHFNLSKQILPLPPYKLKHYLCRSALGFLPVLLIPLHNWYYGHVFVPLTNSAFIPENFSIPPKLYWIAGKNLIIGNFNTEALQSILLHFKKWFPDWEIVFCFALCFWIMYSSKWVSLRILASAAILLQIQSLFWTATSRHLLLARTLSIFATLIYLANLHKMVQFKNLTRKIQRRNLRTDNRIEDS